jgi:ABC-type spermidine/putrescine transport system permease subunit II
MIMESVEVTLAMAFLFFLRLALPLAMTLVLGFTMNRLLDHWKPDIE